MAYIDIDIEDYLDELDDDDLVSELESRGYSCIKNNKETGSPLFRIESLEDEMKIEYLQTLFSDLSSLELMELVNKLGLIKVKIGANQILLPL